MSLLLISYSAAKKTKSLKAKCRQSLVTAALLEESVSFRKS